MIIALNECMAVAVAIHFILFVILSCHCTGKCLAGKEEEKAFKMLQERGELRWSMKTIDSIFKKIPNWWKIPQLKSNLCLFKETKVFFFLFKKRLFFSFLLTFCAVLGVSMSLGVQRHRGVRSSKSPGAPPRGGAEVAGATCRGAVALNDQRKEKKWKCVRAILKAMTKIVSKAILKCVKPFEVCEKPSQLKIPSIGESNETELLSCEVSSDDVNHLSPLSYARLWSWAGHIAEHLQRMASMKLHGAVAIFLPRGVAMASWSIEKSVKLSVSLITSCIISLDVFTAWPSHKTPRWILQKT